MVATAQQKQNTDERRREPMRSSSYAHPFSSHKMSVLLILHVAASLRLSEAFVWQSSRCRSGCTAAMVEGGGGDHLPPSGDLNLFDPDAEGKLQGTGSLHERLKLGADFGAASEEVSPALREIMQLASSLDEDGGSDETTTTTKQVTDNNSKVNLGAAMLAGDAETTTFTGTENTSSPAPDGIVLQLDTSGNTGNPIADPAKVQVDQYPRRSITALGDVPARIQFQRDAGSTQRILKSLQIHILGQPDHFQLLFRDPEGDGLKKRIEYHHNHLLTAVKRYRVVKTWNLAQRRPLDQQESGMIGGAVMQAGSFPVVQSGVVSAGVAGGGNDAADTVTTIDVQFDSSGWLQEIAVDGRTVVTAAGFLDSTYEESERFVCYPEMYLMGRATVEDITFH